MKAVFDTNILIDYLNGIVDARRELTRYDSLLISPITWIEVMVGGKSEENTRLRDFLRRFDWVALDTAVAGVAARLRRTHRIKVPDAVVWASAEVADALLVTRNTKDFPMDLPGIRVPYTL
ncbi:MAG: type II toxin-antitoxin system VapC family toxin [Rhodospirillales bacterium]|nr:type II toxin-antitoxin system VapC family toxin [Rhodospirillales bacterium]